MSTLEEARRILVIDDNDAIHEDFRKILLRSGGQTRLASQKALLFGKPKTAPQPQGASMQFELDSALQGDIGLAKVQDSIAAGRPYSVAFVDMRMPPGWDGLQTIERLWAVDPDLQIVICTAYSDYSWDEISTALGLTDRALILKKPFDPVEVMQLASALSEKRALRERAQQKLDQLEKMVQERTADLTRQAHHDALTGLPNRRLLRAKLQEAIDRSAQDPDYGFAVLFLDFDRFKRVNDSLGHDVGDELLKAIALRLQSAIKLLQQRAADTMAARLGGDEFAILIAGDGCSGQSLEFARTLFGLLGSPYRIGDRDLVCTASVGITRSELKYTRVDHALRDADLAMYHAKAAGKATFALFDQRMHELAASRLETENNLRVAVVREEMLLHYQPIFSLGDGALRGFEALVRWKHPTQGLIMPAQFIPLSEELGLIVPMGYWILRQACQQLRNWIDRDPQCASLTMSVNLSVQQLCFPTLVGSVSEILQQTGVPPQLLILEITESAMIGDKEVALAAMQALRALGVGLHMDDFGTGYSSLSSLHLFPLTGLKIDRSFIRNVGERRDYMAVVNAIITLARHLGMQLTAEGVETAEHVTLLQKLGCDLAQGFFFGRPVPANELDPILAQLGPQVRQASVA